MYNELIDSLRGCADTENIIGGCDINQCKFHCEVPNCIDKMMRDAADAIERLRTELTESQKRIEALQHANGKMFRDIEELRVKNETYRKLILLSTGEINELRFKLHLDNMEIDTVPSIEDLKVPSGKENAYDAIRPN